MSRRSISRRGARLREALEELRARTDLQARRARDPVAFPRRFRDPADMEAAAWLAAALAYGRVPLFTSALERILAVMGAHPGAYVESFDPRRDVEAFRPLYYRLHSGADIACLVYLLQQVVRRHGSLGALVRRAWGAGAADTGPALEGVVGELEALDVAPVYGPGARPRGLGFLARPSRGSACKRLSMLLRWMARPDDGVDLGLWTFIPPARLVVPLDTHLLRIGRYLGLTRRRSGGWRAAVELTRRLAEADPADPLKYDFPLCHLGISGRCPSAARPQECPSCPLLGLCSRGRLLAPAAQASGLRRQSRT